MTDECVVNSSVKPTEVTVGEIEFKLAQFVTILCKFVNERELLLPAEIDTGISAALSDLFFSDRAEIGERVVVVNRADVITPTISKVGTTLHQEQQMMCSSIEERFHSVALCTVERDK